MYQNGLELEQLEQHHSSVGRVSCVLKACALHFAHILLLTMQRQRCRPLADVGPLGPWRPWAVLEVARIALCWAGALGDLACAATALLGTAWVVGRGGLLRGPHAAPLLKLGAGLGGVCGAAGCVYSHQGLRQELGTCRPLQACCLT